MEDYPDSVIIRSSCNLYKFTCWLWIVSKRQTPRTECLEPDRPWLSVASQALKLRPDLVEFVYKYVTRSIRIVQKCVTISIRICTKILRFLFLKNALSSWSLRSRWPILKLVSKYRSESLQCWGGEMLQTTCFLFEHEADIQKTHG